MSDDEGQTNKCKKKINGLRLGSGLGSFVLCFGNICISVSNTKDISIFIFLLKKKVRSFLYHTLQLVSVATHAKVHFMTSNGALCNIGELQFQARCDFIFRFIFFFILLEGWSISNVILYLHRYTDNLDKDPG